MSLRNIFNGNAFLMQKESVDSVTLASSLQQITHSIDSSGNYSVTDKNNNLLLAFDTNNNMITSTVLNTINASVEPLTALVEDLSTSFVSLGGTLSGSSGGSDVSLSTLQSDITTLQTSLSTLQTSVSTLQTTVTAQQEYLSTLEGFFSALYNTATISGVTIPMWSTLTGTDESSGSESKDMG